MNSQRDKKSGIVLNNLSVGYHGKPLFAPSELYIPAETFNVIIGANGVGKSTLMHTIAGSLEPVTGNIAINGEDLRNLSDKKLARLVSHVYTDRITAGGLTVKELVQMGRYPHIGFLGRLSSTDKDIVNEALADVGISHKADSFLSDISDGERQKAMITRALAQQTPVMMFDEPTNFLDAASRLEILGLISRLVRQNGITAILSTHDIPVAISLADNVITILPDDPNPVTIHPARSSQAFDRLNRIYISRNISFDSSKLDFVINGGE